MTPIAPIEISVAGGGRILAIPAIHYASRFALAVHQLAEHRALHDTSERLAIAVELGPAAAASLAAWIKELGAENPLPTMLGLARNNNRLIHPKYKEASLRLQELHGLPLHQISPDILQQELNYSSSSLLCLSSTDSIIEAVRCAIQYGVDIYGIDLEDVASSERKEVLLEDSLSIDNLSSIDHYVRHNAGRYASSRDSFIDSRREQVMAARLKGLAQEYESVLYTGGMGHWIELKKYLRDPELKVTSPLINSGRVSEYKRVIVDPSLAISQMGALPACTAYYEMMRAQPYGTPWKNFDLRGKALAQIKRAYDSAAMDNEGHYDGVALEQSPHFWFYLNNISLLRQQLVPRLNSVIEAATAMLSEEYALRVGKELVFAPELSWLQAEDAPELPYLHSPRFESTEYDLGNGHKVELNSSSGKSEDSFYIQSPPDEGMKIDHKFQATLTEHQFATQRDKDTFSEMAYRNPWIWPPNENFFYGSAYHIAEHIMPPASASNGEPFSGSMAKGIDIKATLRATARNDKRFYVKVTSGSRSMSRQDLLAEPFVYIFEYPQTDRQKENINWDISYAGTGNVKAHHFNSAATRKHFIDITNEQGSNFVASVQFSEDCPSPEHLTSCNDIRNMRLLWGAMSFGNPCNNIYQCARWLEGSHFKCSPALKDLGREALITFYKDNFNMALDMENWPESLIRIAIPFARHRVLVIAPDRKAITQQIQLDARNFGVDIDLVPLSYISAKRINMIRHQHVVYPLNIDATDWSTEVVNLLGSVDAYQDLLPSWIQAQTVQNN
ncbi:MAG: hypothetical protein methR_P0621 [Methyloprofundus sp.]|nr:MAG: hypothetical protein methR_P0621 [Methyloprofundus sp.]